MSIRQNILYLLEDGSQKQRDLNRRVELERLLMQERK